MYIELYVDILFLICLIPELFSLWLLGFWQGNPRQGQSRGRYGWRLLWVSGLSAGLSVAAAICLRQAGFLGLLFADVWLQCLAFRLVFGRQRLRQTLELWLLQKLFFFALGGLLQTGWSRGHGRIGVAALLSGFVAGGIFFYALIASVKRKKRLERLLFSVSVYRQGRSCCCLALLDTGNQLYYGTSPVLLLDKEPASKLGFSWEEPGEGYRLIPYASVGCTSGVLHGFICDRIEIQAGKEQGGEESRSYEQVVIGVAEHPLSHTGEYQMLLHPALL